MLTEHETAAYVFECDADLAQTHEANRMRDSFERAALRAVYCPYCLFMRDTSVKVAADGSCALCASEVR